MNQRGILMLISILFSTALISNEGISTKSMLDGILLPMPKLKATLTITADGSECNLKSQIPAVVDPANEPLKATFFEDCLISVKTKDGSLKKLRIVGVLSVRYVKRAESNRSYSFQLLSIDADSTHPAFEQATAVFAMTSGDKDSMYMFGSAKLVNDPGASINYGLIVDRDE
jgi:hypothetical protein